MFVILYVCVIVCLRYCMFVFVYETGARSVELSVRWERRLKLHSYTMACCVNVTEEIVHVSVCVCKCVCVCAHACLCLCLLCVCVCVLLWCVCIRCLSSIIMFVCMCVGLSPAHCR